MRRILQITSLFAACSHGVIHASFKYGYGDNPCTVTIASIAKEKPFGFVSGEGLLIQYDYACPDGIRYSVKTRQSKYGEISSQLGTPTPVEITKANPCMPAVISDDKPPTYDEVNKKIVVYYNTFPGVETCPDLTLQASVGAYATYPFPTKAGSIVQWSSTGEVVSSNNASEKYVSGEYAVSLPYGNRVIPAKTFQSVSGVWQDNDTKIDNSRWFAKITSPDPKYFAIVHLLPGFTDGDFYNKPLVIGDAFDPTNSRGLTSDAKVPDYVLISNSVQYQNLLSKAGPRSKGYDVYFLDFSQGAGDIHINAKLELKFIEWLSERAKSKIIVSGISMGGVISRLALLYSLPQNSGANPPQDLGRRVKGFLSIDAPMQGASVSSDLQRAMYELSGTTIAIFADYTGLGSSARDSWAQMSAPASQQLLYDHFYAVGTSSEGHDAFYAHLKKLGGYRKDIPSAAIAYSNFYQNSYPGNNVQKQVLEIDPPGLAVRHVWARNHEFDPGSSADWYWSCFKGKSIPTLKALYFDNPVERFKGTFIPIQSALDLTAPVPANSWPSNYSLSANSPFNFAYYMKNTYNGYCDLNNTCRQLDAANKRTTIEDKRFTHMVFDKALMTNINNALDRLEASSVSLNNDKYDDLLFFDPATASISGAWSLGTGFQKIGGMSYDAFQSTDRDYLYLGDFDGDGLTDMGFLDPTNAFKVGKSNGGMFGMMSTWIGANGFGDRSGKHYVGDFNGDGKDDLLYFQIGGNSLHVNLSTGSGFGAAGSGMWIPSNGFGSLKSRYYPADYNGDGKTDLGYFESDQSFFVTLSTGTGFGAPGSGQWFVGGNFGNTTVTPYVGDFTGDGRDDLMIFSYPSNSIWVLPSKGNGFAASQQWAAANGFFSTPNYFPADYDGDGICDLGFYDKAQNTFWVKTANANGTGFGPHYAWTIPNTYGNIIGRFMPTYKKKRIVIN